MSESATRITEREADVLAALGAHLSNAQIAHRLNISVRTVETHVSSLLRKYGYADRRSLAELAEQVLAGRSAVGGVSGLPTADTSLIGRQSDLEEVRAALEASRLVTVLGPGGVGKTRLAIAAAETVSSDFPSGGAFVDLVPVRAGFVVRATASALGVTEGSHQPTADAVVDYVGNKRALLVFDNCEQVIDDAAGVAERILSSCPGTRIVATSREPLGIAGERRVQLGALPLDPDAVQLFLDRALAIDPGFVADPEAIAQVCAQLDCMPLAIELAAARSASLGVSGVLAALDESLELLVAGRGGDDRHRSVRAVIAWSYDLLDEAEKRLFRRLGVFVGAFDMAAARAVGGGASQVADVLGRLVDKSLVVHVRGTPSRWRLLDTVRAFALEQLDTAGETEQARLRHREWAATLAAELDHQLDASWQGEFDLVAADLREALNTAPPGPDPVTHGLAAALAHLSYARRHLRDALTQYQSAAACAVSDIDAALDLSRAAGCAHVSSTSDQQMFELLVASASHSAASGDGNGQAIELARAVETACRYADLNDVVVPRDSLTSLLAKAERSGDQEHPVVAAAVAVARAWYDGPAGGGPDPELAATAVNLARQSDDAIAISAAAATVAEAELHRGRLREANRFAQQRMALLERLDHDEPRHAAEICNTFGRASVYAIAAGDVPRALAAARASYSDDLLRRSHFTLGRLVFPLVLTGMLHEATQRAAEMWDAWQRAGWPSNRLAHAGAAAMLAHGLLGEQPASREWRTRLRHLAPGGFGARPSAAIAFAELRLALHTGDHLDPESLIDRWTSALEVADPYRTYAVAAAAELAVVTRHPHAMHHLATAVEAAHENDWATYCVARATARQQHDPIALESVALGWEGLEARLERAYTLLLIPGLAPEGETEFRDLGAAVPKI